MVEVKGVDEGDGPALGQWMPVVGHAGQIALIGPARLPAAEIKRLHAAVVMAFETPELKEAMARQANVIHPSSPEAAREFFKTEQARHARLVQKADVKPD